MSHCITNYKCEHDTMSRLCLLTDDFDLSQKSHSPWEREYQFKYGQQPQMLRAILAGTMSMMGIPLKDRAWYNFRYYHGIFDSVSDYFVIVDVKLPVRVVLPPPSVVTVDGWDVQIPFSLSMCRQHEVTPHSPRYSSMRDLDYLFLQTADFNDPAVVMREKLNGTPFFRVRCNKRVYFVGSGVGFLVPDDFPVEMAEWTPTGFSVLHPYALPDYTYQGVTFTSHLWEAVDALRVLQYSHGAVFNFDGIELRSRRVPTVEVVSSDVVGSQCKGVWEVSGSSFRMCRPRPGKPPMALDKARDVLGFAVPLSVITLPVRNGPAVRHVTFGSYRGSFGVDEAGPWFDSGIRLVQGSPVLACRQGEFTDVTKVVLADDIYHHQFPSGSVVSPYAEPCFHNVVTGAKILLFDSDDNTYLIKDGDKLLDLVGGKIERDETSYDAVMREISEELGPSVRLEPRQLCVSSQVTALCSFHSVLYVAPLPMTVVRSYCDHSLVKFSGFEYDYGASVPWLPRLVNAVRDRCGGKSLGLPKLYGSLPVRPWKRKLVLCDGGQSSHPYVDARTIRKGL